MTEFVESIGMVATSSSLKLVSVVLGFDLVELWCRDDPGSKPRCIYVEADRQTSEKYPDLITGHFPNHAKEHKLSPKLCQEAHDSEEKYIWRILPEDSYQIAMKDSMNGKESTYKDVHLPVKTEMSFLLEADTGNVEIFIVCLSTKEIPFHPSKLRFLSGLGYAIYIAAFDMDAADEEKARVSTIETERQLDQLHHPDALRPQDLIDTLPESLKQAAKIAPAAPPPRRKSRDSSPAHSRKEDDSDEKRSIATTDSQIVQDQAFKSNYVFPIVNIPFAKHIPEDYTLDDFADVKHIADGSNANIFLAMKKREQVIIKMIKTEVEHDPVAIEEFELERAMLSRLSHPTIIKILGSGMSPRRFVVLEYLGGGSLNTLLNENLAKPGLAQKLFRKPTFTYLQLLQAAKDMAEALHYMHFKVYEGATILHRDLKPDNIGFTSDGKLKIFDLGLVTCVKTRKTINTAYDMTGYTGSLRYMAPEVALRLPYTEKVDVYSYAIVVWQMARDRIPFKGLNRDEFFQLVVADGERPKLDKTWPPQFSDLLTQCWHKDPNRRPGFDAVISELDKLITSAGGKKVAIPPVITNAKKK